MITIHTYIDESIRNIQLYLMATKACHNTVAEIVPDTHVRGFVAEILTKNNQVWLKILVNARSRTVTLEAYPCISIIDAIHYKKRMDAENSNPKETDTSLDPSSNFYIRLETGIKDAPVTFETIAQMENIILNLMLKYDKDLEQMVRDVLSGTCEQEALNPPGPPTDKRQKPQRGKRRAKGRDSDADKKTDRKEDDT